MFHRYTCKLCLLSFLFVFFIEAEVLCSSLNHHISNHVIEKPYSIGVSIGGSNIRVGLVSQSGHLLHNPQELRWREEIGENSTSEVLIDNIIEKIAQLLENIDDVTHIKKIGISSAGPIDPIKGIAGTPFPGPYLPFDHYEIVKEIEKKYKKLIKDRRGIKETPLKISLYNDSHAAVLGEFSQKKRELQNGMIFILGTGTNGAVIKNGKVYTDNNALIELGFNLIKRNKKDGKWEFLGKKTRGNKPKKCKEDQFNIDLFNGEGIALQFIQYKAAFPIAIKFVTLPNGISSIHQLFDIIEKKDGDPLRPLAIEALLKAISKAIYAKSLDAVKFIETIGIDLGRSLATLIQDYHKNKWVEHIILVGSVGEELGKPNKNSVDPDVFIEAIRRGFGESLEKFSANSEDKELNKRRINLITQGIERSQMHWEREILAAKLTENDTGKGDKNENY